MRRLSGGEVLLSGGEPCAADERHQTAAIVSEPVGAAMIGTLISGRDCGTVDRGLPRGGAPSPRAPTPLTAPRKPVRPRANATAAATAPSPQPAKPPATKPATGPSPTAARSAPGATKAAIRAKLADGD